MNELVVTRTQGAKANRSGKVAEEVIATILREYDIPYIRQYPIGEGTYKGKSLRVDFFLPKHFVIIESRWQSVSGTADEKFPYMCMNIKGHYPYGTIIVLGGKGWGNGALEWIRNQVDGAVLIDVFTVDDLREWCRKQW